jgi:hypothetical protein
MTHLIGSCFYSKEHKLAFLNIPRVASTSIKNALGWQYYKSFREIENNGFNIKHIIVVLRDPVSRWESAMNLMANNNYFDSLDDHLTAQVEFIPVDIDRNKVVPFYFNVNVLADIATHFNLDIDTTVYENKTKIKMINVLDDSFIKNMYHMDYRLIEIADFVNLTK